MCVLGEFFSWALPNEITAFNSKKKTTTNNNKRERERREKKRKSSHREEPKSCAAQLQSQNKFVEEKKRVEPDALQSSSIATVSHTKNQKYAPHSREKRRERRKGAKNKKERTNERKMR
jgi:hypothetical protein